MFGLMDSVRAGRYVEQPAGYRAFLLTPRPPTPPVDRANRQDLLSRADRALGLPGEITGQARNRRSRYAPYIRLFAEEETEAPVASEDGVGT